MTKRAKVESGRSGPEITAISGLTGDDARIAYWVDDAWMEIQRRPHGWKFMRKNLDGLTVAGTRIYTAADLDAGAADFGSWLPPATEHYKVKAGYVGGDKWDLRFVPWEKFRDAFELTTHEQGAPQYWSISPDDEFCVGPTPNDVYEIKAVYYRVPTHLVADSDTPDMPEAFHMIIVWRALMELAGFDAAPEVYSRASANFENLDTDLRHSQGPKISMGTVTL